MLTMYLADAYSGVLILQHDGDYRFSVKETMQIDGEVSALGVCTEMSEIYLAVATAPGDVFEYAIEENMTKPTLATYFPRHNNSNHTYKTLGPRITCSPNENEYYAFAMTSAT